MGQLPAEGDRSMAAQLVVVWWWNGVVAGGGRWYTGVLPVGQEEEKARRRWSMAPVCGETAGFWVLGVACGPATEYSDTGTAPAGSPDALITLIVLNWRL